MNLLDDLKHLFVLLYTHVENNMPVNTSHSQVKVLRFLIKHQNEPITQKEIEQHLGLSKATVSGILKTMEKHELVIRQVHNDDTRLKTVQITTKAIACYQQASAYFKTLEEQLCAGIEQEKLNQFKETLYQMSLNLERKDEKHAQNHQISE